MVGVFRRRCDKRGKRKEERGFIGKLVIHRVSGALMDIFEN
jgi:hypothetical protein